MISTNSTQFNILLSTVYKETLRSLQYKKQHLLTTYCEAEYAF